MTKNPELKVVPKSVPAEPPVDIRATADTLHRELGSPLPAPDWLVDRLELALKRGGRKEVFAELGRILGEHGIAR